MQRVNLAREYELPKKPIFLLDDDDNIVQSSDAATFVFGSVLDSVMYGTNGNIGLRHRSESETVGCTTEVMINGVYHVQQRDLVGGADVVPKTKQVGAIIGVTTIDTLIDDVSGTLSGLPLRKLSLKDGCYRSVCRDVLSADGGLYFDSDYTRCVSSGDANLWGVELVCSNFRLQQAEGGGTPVSEGGSTDMLTTAAAAAGNSSAALLQRWGGGNGHDSPADNAIDAAAAAAAAAGSASSASSMQPQQQAAQASSPRGRPAPGYKLEVVVSFAIDLDEWEVLKADRMDELWQRSLSSNIAVMTTTSVACTAEYKSNTSQIECEVELTTAAEGGEQEGSSRLSMERYSAAGAMVGGGAYAKDHHPSSPGLAGVSMSQAGGMGGRAIAIAAGGVGNVVGSPPSGLQSRTNTSFDLLTATSVHEVRRLVVRKRFVVPLSGDNLPRSVRLSFMARHHTGVKAPAQPFPTVAQIIAERRLSLEAFWRTCDVDLQLQDELLPNRARMPLLYNAFRLFGVGYNLTRGLPRAGCSCAGEGLEYELAHYIYYGIYYTFTQPDCALSLLQSLYHLLPQARRNARYISLPSGAIYPTCTIAGNNFRPYTNINNARFHVNAEIGYLIYIYHCAVEGISAEDRLMLLEMLLETARVWPSLGEWLQDGVTFRLDNINGADEYNNSASGNFYIHLCAKKHLEQAVELLHQHEKLLGVAEVDRLLEAIAMTRDEVAELGRVASSIWVHRNDRLGVYMMHDSFDALAEWCADHVKHPMHLNYHPLTIFRKKVVNIPEVPLGMLLYEPLFEPRDFERNYEYYLPLCTFDAPEALGIMAIAQCRGKQDFAQPIPALRSLSCLDLDNIIYAGDEGLHFGPMAMSMLTLLCGMGGVRCFWDALHVNPILPAGVIQYRFTVCWRGAVMRVTVNTEELVYELIAGDSLRFIHGVAQHRIHLHTGFCRRQAVRRFVIERGLSMPVREFDGAIIFSDCLFHNLLEYSYLSWLRTLETLFDSYRTLQNRPIPPLNPEEYISDVVYQVEEGEIAFSGINNVLRQRNIHLDLGSPDDAEIVETRHGLANAKVAEMSELLARETPPVVADLFAMIKSLARSGVALAIVTYSRSLRQLMSYYADLAHCFVARIDGEEAHDRKIKGRPHLDLYLRAAEKIHVDPSRCIVVAHHLDRDYRAEDLAQFCMFLDVDDPFVSSRVPPQPYPTLGKEYTEKHHRDRPIVSRLYLANIPTTIEDIEDIVDGRATSAPL